MDDLFGVSHANANERITIEEDNQFLTVKSKKAIWSLSPEKK